MRKTNLPKYVTFNHGAYYFRPNNKTWIHLGRSESEMYLALANLTTGVNAHSDTMDMHFARYLKEDTPKKATSTQKEEVRIMRNLMKSFGQMRPAEIKPHHVFTYHQARSKTTPNGADREKALLSSVMAKLMNIGVVDRNPCLGIKKNGSKVRMRYVTDAEFAAVYKHASPIMQVAMSIAYLTGLRMGDIISLTQADIKEDGLYCDTSKTTRAMIYNWSDALLDAINKAREHTGNSTYIIANKHGQRYTASGFKSSWQRLIRQASEAENIERFQFRDLRTKAAEDTSENAQRLLGHSSDKITNRNYKVRPWRVNPTR
jgi:integrase